MTETIRPTGASGTVTGAEHCGHARRRPAAVGGAERRAVQSGQRVRIMGAVAFSTPTPRSRLKLLLRWRGIALRRGAIVATAGPKSFALEHLQDGAVNFVAEVNHLGVRKLLHEVDERLPDGHHLAGLVPIVGRFPLLVVGRLPLGHDAMMRHWWPPSNRTIRCCGPHKTHNSRQLDKINRVGLTCGIHKCIVRPS